MSEPAEPIETLRVSPFDILVDPNSYRLIEDPLWEPMPDELIADPEVQQQAFASIRRSPRFLDLERSVDENGWLEVDPIRVRRRTSGGLVVVDGNRRIVALRSCLWRRRGAVGGAGPAPTDIGSRDGLILVQVEAHPTHDEAIRSLAARHLLRGPPWPGIGSAICREAIEQSSGRELKIPERASPSPQPARVALDALELARYYRRGPWGADYKPLIYTLFCEALMFSAISRWLKPVDEGRNDERLNRLCDWLSQTETASRTDEPEGENERSGTARRIIHDPMDLRRLNLVIDKPEMLERLDAGESVLSVFLSTRSPIIVDEPDIHLHPTVSSMIAQKVPIDSRRAQSAISELRDALRRQGEEPVESGTDYPWELVAPGEALFLKNLTLHHFRGLSDVSLADLGRVNLLVGVNNAGKTSVLEALYILSRLSDPRGLFDTLRTRSRQDVERTPKRLADLVDGLEIDISASDLKGRKLGIQLKRPEPAEGTDVATHITDLRFEATLGAVRIATLTSLFSDRRRVTRAVGPTRWLAPAVLHSPFWRHDRSAVVDWYKASFTEGTIPLILKTIQESVDDGITDIRNVSEEIEFRVQHKNLRTMDLVNYGEGVQRVFEIGLLFAAHRGGLVLIDELETAVHTKALLGFSRMIHELAVAFDVQVFITTHSNETVHAFTLNGFRTNDVVAYGLYRTADSMEVTRYPGVDLASAIDAINIDIRRG